MNPSVLRAPKKARLNKANRCIFIWLEKILLITELIPGGTLESFLISKPAPGEHGKYENFKCALNDRELIKIALQIASGMQHLESKKVRDRLFKNIVPKCPLFLCYNETWSSFMLRQMPSKEMHFIFSDLLYISMYSLKWKLT